MRIGIVLLPDSITSTLARSYSEKFKNRDDLAFTLGVETNVPHITLYHFDPKPDIGIETIIASANGLCPPGDLWTVPISGCLGSIRQYHNYVLWYTSLTPELVSLHEHTVRTFASMRSPLPTVDVAHSEVERINVEKYGAANVMEGFNPHLTLGAASDLGDVGFHSEEFPLVWHADWLAVAEIGEYGRVVKVIAKIEMPQPSDATA